MALGDNQGYGYVESDIKNSLNNIQSAYDDTIGALAGDLQNKFVDQMKDKWASKNARDFFVTFESVSNDLINAINSTFESIFATINEAADAYAKEGGDVWSRVSFSRSDKRLDVSAIQENVNGVRGIDPEANNVAEELMNVKASVDASLDSASSAVSNSGFVNESDRESLKNSLKTIRDNISEDFTSLSNDCKKAINATLESYGSLSSKVTDAFTAK